MDPRQRRMRRQGQGGRGPGGAGPPGQTGVMPPQAQGPPPGGMPGPPPGAAAPMGTMPMTRGPVAGVEAGVPAGMGGQPSMLKPMAIDPMNREAARNQRMNTAWQQQLAQQGGMGYGGPGAMQTASVDPMLKPMAVPMAEAGGIAGPRQGAIASLLRSG